MGIIPMGIIFKERRMIIKGASFGYTTNNLTETKSFYRDILNAEILYEIEGYIILKLTEFIFLEFVQSEAKNHINYTNIETGFNIEVSDVDSVYKEITSKKVEIIMPLESHPWGERAFAIKDPNNLTIYILSRTDKT